MCGDSSGSPIIFRAKYALTLALMSKAPSWKSGHPPWPPWMRRR
jgi:hypothetical protein